MNISNDQYIKDLEQQNGELSDRLALAETKLKSLERRKGTYPVFKLFKRQLKRDLWTIDCEYLTNCDTKKAIIPVIRFTINNPITIDPKEQLIGFQYWRQAINYRWALSGNCKYIDLNLEQVYNIEINSKTGEIVYRVLA